MIKRLVYSLCGDSEFFKTYVQCIAVVIYVFTVNSSTAVIYLLCQLPVEKLKDAKNV